MVVEVDERAVALGQAFFDPLIGRAVELLASYDERELAAVRGFLAGVREVAATADRPPARH
ncbi:hypothetical protein [Streptomyces bobili]|uniref:hypothetical protein n=1 Tax=Streptomyces bobili TaxID=67280 RepID=UPI003F54078D